MMRGMGNMQGMMKQVQKMQKEMVAAQDTLNAQSFVGESTSGYVKATFTGDRKLTDLAIDPAIADDIEMVQDLVLMAVNDGLSKVEKESEKVMGKYTKGIPGL